MKLHTRSRLSLYYVGTAVTLAFASPALVSYQDTSFPALVAQFRGTGGNQAVSVLATWPDARLQAEVGTFENADPWHRAAAALLLLEATLLKVDFHTDDGHALRLAQPGHLLYSTTLPWIRSLSQRAEETGQPALLGFCRDYLILLQITASGVHGGKSGVIPLESLHRFFSTDARFELLSGTIAATLVGPLRDSDGGVYAQGIDPSQSDSRVISANGERYWAEGVRRAELALRRALELDPSLAEAHLRLGRLYQQLNRTRDADRHLASAIRLAAAEEDRLTGYLAELFRARMFQQSNRPTDAIGGYERAAAIFPPGYVARLALGQALFSSGRSDEAWGASRTVFGPEVQPPSRDPWSRFSSPDYGRITRRLAGLRARVSSTPLPLATKVRTVGSVADESPFAPPVADQTATVGPRRPTFRSTLESIRVDLLVLDEGRPVVGLQAADFQVTDNGVRQRVEALAEGQSLAAGIVLDTSMSMRQADQWARAQRSLASISSALREKDTFSLLTASDKLALRGDLLERPGVLLTLTASVRPEAYATSAVWDGVLAAGSLVAESAGRPVVIVVSDAWDNTSWFERRDALRQFERWGVIVDVVRIPFRTNRDTLDIAFGAVDPLPLVRPTGGIVVSADESDLDGRLADRFAILRQGYLLTYSRSAVKPQKDGWHEIKVTLRPGVRGRVVQARPGYYARQVK